ncbi:anaphase promoting complex subunit cdc16 [Haplosporangium sp. Z 27]|nr:anaphase promoting complex subunit cdc16 [Haplosporangium sp. Z 27]
MPTTPVRRARGQGSSHDQSTTPGGQTQQAGFQTPTNNTYTGHTTRLRSATRSAAAFASATTPTGNNNNNLSSGTRSTNVSPNNSFTTPTRQTPTQTPTRQTPTRHTRQRSSISGGNGSIDWGSQVGGGGTGGNSGAGSGSGSGTGAPGSASSTTSVSATSTSRQLRGPPLPNPHVTLKRTSGSSGSLSGPGNSSFSATLASLSELSPGASGPWTPNALSRRSQPSTANQSMRVIPSPFANSPASWLETSYLPSPVKGYGGVPGSASSFAAVGSVGNLGPGSGSIFDVASAPNSIGNRLSLPGDQAGYDNSYSSAIDFFAPAEIHRERSTVDSMRAWRTDAMHQHMYKTAAFWGDKVLSITDDSNDVFWLSQVYYLMGEYGRAINLLQKQKLLESSVACRFLAIQCMVRTEKWTEALEYLGEENQYSKESASESSVNNADGGIKLEASMCYLRGIVYKSMHNMDKAKECFKEALRIDVKCYDALDSLISNSMLTNSEEREMLESLEFERQLHGPDAVFVKMLYESRLKKYDHLEEQDEIYKTLSSKFQTENADLLYSKAEIYFTQCCFDKCLECTKRILEMDKFNLACMPMHLVSLYELDLKNELFYLAHELVDQHPKLAIAWFAVGVYYYLIGNLQEARMYFSKASSIDGHYGPAWIGFGHSFALEGEHDQAISAYSTSAKLFHGSHLGHLYIGMQHLQQNNMMVAQQYLTFSLTICDSDPLLLNEIGVLHYNLGQFDDAVKSFHKVIEKLRRSQRKNVIWETTWLNLAHSYRKLGKFLDAETYFLKVDGITNPGPTKASALTGLGFIYQIMNQTSDAVECYHKVLAIRPGDQIASDMLQKIMEDRVRVAEMEWMHEYLPEEFQDDDEVEKRLRALEERNANALMALGSSSSSSTLPPASTSSTATAVTGTSSTGSATGKTKRKGYTTAVLSTATRSRSKKGKEIIANEVEEEWTDDRMEMDET